MNDKPKIAIIGLSGQSVFLNIDDFPSPGETIKAKYIHNEPGGKGYNQAAMILKLGGKVSFLSVVGDDSYANDCIKGLEHPNAKLFFRKVAGKSTAFASILTNKESENQVIVYPGVSNEITIDDVINFQDEIISANILLLTLELPIDVVNFAIKIAKENNVFILLNPAPYNENFNQYDECDLLTPNEIEAKQIYKVNDINNLKNQTKLVVTLGSKGAIYFDKNLKKEFPPVKVNAVDTTGAGDVFNATLAYFLAKNNNIEYAISKANKIAARSTTELFVINAINKIKLDK